MRVTGAEQPVVAKKSVKADGAKGLRHPARNGSQPQGREELSDQAKSFSISKMVVWEAYCDVKANKGAAGVDSKSLDDFDQDLKNNLYKLWNRMSSGTYFPKPVRRVGIPKAGGGMRQLGIPTVEDRIAQAVAKKYLEPLVEPQFHRDSYGYRPGKSALDAVEVTRRRCWQYDWVIDLDIRGFFDNLDHELVLRAVRRYTSEKWMLLYIERWLKVPVQKEDGELETREKGTPQGGVISPLLANIFMHLAFDDWMETYHPQTPFARYADDVIVHCRTLEEAQCLLALIKRRLARCLLDLHPSKTKIVYCKDGKRPSHHINEAFDFLGYTFRPRRVWSRYGPTFIGFTPAVSRKAEKAMRRKIRAWRLGLWTGRELGDIADTLNPVIRGWIRYYGRFYRSALRRVFHHLDHCLAKWVMRKYKKFGRHRKRAIHWLGRVASREPNLFAHWKELGLRPATG